MSISFPALTNRYFRSLLTLLSVLLLGVGTFSTIAVVNPMAIPTVIARLYAPQITVAELQQGKVKPVILVDVRSREEYLEDHIEGSQWVPITDVESGTGVPKIAQIIQDNTRLGQPQPTIVLYCAAGPRSIRVWQHVKSLKAQFVVLKGGITEWRKLVTPRQDRQALTAAG